jgi:hypothetical protein
MVRITPVFLTFLLLAACSKSKREAPKDTGGSGGETSTPPPRASKDAGPMRVADPITPDMAVDAGAVAVATPDAGPRENHKGNPKGNGKKPAPDAAPEVVAAVDAGAPDPELPRGVQWRTKNDSGFVLKADAPKPIAAGETAHFKLEVTPAEGRKINWCAAGEADCDPFPISLKLEPPDGLKVKKTQIGDDDVTIDKKHIVIDIPVTATKAGSYEMPGIFKFAVCTDSECEPKRLEMAFLLGVK